MFKKKYMIKSCNKNWAIYQPLCIVAYMSHNCWSGSWITCYCHDRNRLCIVLTLKWKSIDVKCQLFAFSSKNTLYLIINTEWTNACHSVVTYVAWYDAQQKCSFERDVTVFWVNIFARVRSESIHKCAIWILWFNFFVQIQNWIDFRYK